VGIRMTDDYETDDDARELLGAALPTKISFLLELAGRQPAAD
jgi:hypothetical protein